MRETSQRMTALPVAMTPRPVLHVMSAPAARVTNEDALALPPRPIPNCIGQVRWPDGVAAGQVGNGARQFQNPVKGAVVASPYQLPHIA